MNSPDDGFVIDAEHARPHGWLHRLGAVLWPSFLTAGVATAAFFANVDPEGLRLASLPQLGDHPRGGLHGGSFSCSGR
jgi:hypothetical protein